MLIDSFLAAYMRRAVRRRMSMRWVEKPFCPRPEDARERLLYVHVPFCESLCPYCTFHRVAFEPGLAARYFTTLRREIKIYKDLGFRFNGVYVGGGTPTVLPWQLASLIGFIRDLWPIERVSVEAHPRHLTAGTVAVLKDAGVERLSVGVQTFDDGLLEKLSRHHGPGAGRQARQRLQGVRGEFETVNVDMIYNFPGQTTRQLLEDVRILRELDMDQVTFYPLMQAGRDFRRVFGKPSARREKKLHAEIVGALGDSYKPVTGWCFARRRGTPDEYIVAHDEYAGLGSGAFGYLNGALYANSFDVARYMEAVTRAELPIVAVRKFPEAARLRYDFLMRLFGGCLDLSDLESKYGARCGRELWKELLFLRLVGVISRRGSRYCLTPGGRYGLVILMREFFSGANRLRAFLSGSPSAPAPAPAAAAAGPAHAAGGAAVPRESARPSVEEPGAPASFAIRLASCPPSA
ncbi:MAG: coproporphyrinogen III oxidase family protein [Lentisphaerae bacterium]|nr:coproporphyrinogen III oxidase family protein [Lentisphaerota bacterium]